MDHKCIYCKDGWTWCFGPMPTEGSGLVALACQNCINKYEAISDLEERKQAIKKDAVDRMNVLVNEFFEIACVFMPCDENIAADKEFFERLAKAFRIIMNLEN